MEMDATMLFALAAGVVALVSLAWAAWTWWQVRALGLGLGLQVGPLLERLGAIGQRLEALEGEQGRLEAGQGRLEAALGRCGLHPTVHHYAPLGMGGVRNCFVLALLNRAGDGVVLNYLTGISVRVDLKEVHGWKSWGLSLTAEEQEAVGENRAWWEGGME